MKIKDLVKQMDLARQNWGIPCSQCGEIMDYCILCSHPIGPRNIMEGREMIFHHRKYFLAEHRREQRFDKYHTDKSA